MVVVQMMLSEREGCAITVEELADNMPELVLCLGEMTAQEKRTAQAALRLAAQKIRRRGNAR